MILKRDARKYLPTIADNFADLILSDPPYDFDENTKQFYHQQFTRISNGGIIVFAPPENQWIQPADQTLFWVKPTSTKNTSKRYSRFVEMIFVYGSPRWITGRHWSQYTNIFTDLVDSTAKHNYRKPPSMIERLILNHTQVGDVILDPFAGSGVVEEVGTRLGRYVFGSDINAT